MIYTSEFPPGPGGLGELAYQTSNEMSKRGFSVFVLCNQDFAESDDIHKFNESQNFIIRSFTSTGPSLFTAVKKVFVFISCCFKYRPSILLTTGTIPTLISFTSFLVPSIKKMTVLHASEFQSAFAKVPWVIKPILWRSCLIAVSEYTKNYNRNWGISRRIHVLNNSARIPEITNSDLTSDLEKKYHNKTVLMTVGRMYDRKGQEFVIRSLPDVLKTHPHVVYLLVGNETKREYLEGISRELGIQDSVHFIGQVSRKDLPSYQNLCDIYILLSQNLADGDFEGFGISVIEAAFLGKPAIGSKTCGIADAIEDGKTGILVSPRDSDEIVSAVKKLTDDEGLRMKMGEAAKERAYNQFTWDHYIEKFIKLIDLEFNKDWSTKPPSVPS
ncbi:glycosyltransferase family 4 protein [Fibrobacterota bacterium]